MDRVITVTSASSGATADVRLATTGTTLADVLPELRQLTSSSSGPVVRDGRRLPPSTPIALVRDGDLLVLDGDEATAERASVTCDVVSGPDAGQAFELRPGRHVLGRDEPPLASTDALVSRHHIAVEVTGDNEVTVTDLHARNGSRIDGVLLPPDVPTPWPSGTALSIGDSVLVHGRRPAPAAVVAAPGGLITVNRAPRMTTPTSRVKISFPSPAPPPAAARAPLLASCAPLAAGVSMALFLRRWEFLAFALMSPLALLAQWASDLVRLRRVRRRAAGEHADALAAAQQSLAAAVAAEAAQRHAASPDLGALVRAALERSSLLWHRGPDDEDALTLRLGSGTVPATVDVDGAPTPAVAGVPVCLDLRRLRVLGVCGPHQQAAGVARALAVQAATLLGPGALQIRVLAPGRSSQWAWSRWLPHLRDTSGAPSGLTSHSIDIPAALADLRAGCDAQHQLVIVDGVGDVTVATRLADLPATTVVWLGGSEPALPSACGGVVSVSGTPPRASVHQDGERIDDVIPDQLAVPVAESVARSLCPLRDSVAIATAIPAEVRWSALHGLPLAEDSQTVARALARRWAGGPTTAVRIGVTVDAPCVIDLQRDGPHMLVAGTTGSGKSELLQTFVASLVVDNAPSELTLLLVDYKGGAAFGTCATLPHTVGVLTDLDAAATTRAIDSLSAELRRRERALAEAGAPDLDTWRRRRPPGHAPMPRLVIVVDEFATLAEELPDFVGGLVGIAQRGRSLGVHLVLATQRPEGAVSADIRANMSLRVCLAVAREVESRDVIDGPQALSISRDTPGRALVRIGNNALVEMQTARVSGSVADAEHRLVEVVTPGRSRADAERHRTDGPTELDALVTASVAAAELVGAAIPPPPWLPPLPHQVALSDLATDTTDGTGVPIGIIDLPQSQCQPPLRVDVDRAEPLLIVGGPRSGRTSAAVAVATALAAAAPPDRLHLWAIDSGNSLSALTELPHTGAVVDARDAERLERLLAFLGTEIERRRGGRPAAPSLLLVVDGWDGLVHATADVDAGRCQDQLLRLVSDGAAVGLRVVMTSDRSGLTGRVASVFAERICLRLADPADYAMFGLPLRQVPADLPSGRGIRNTSGELALVQIAQADARAFAAATAWTVQTDGPRRFDPLPARVPLHALPRGPGHRLVVGVRADDLSPACVDPTETGGALLIAGPTRSGRSTALVSIASQLRSRPVIAVCARPGPLHRRRDLALLLDASDVQQVCAAVRAEPDAALLVDDIELVDDPGVLDVIEQAVRSARDGRGFVVLAGATDAMATAFRGPIAHARRGRSGVLLRPEGPQDGELFGLRLRRRRAMSDPPGRGLLALHGHALPVQLADPG